VSDLGACIANHAVITIDSPPALETPSFSAVSFSLITNDMSLFSASFAYVDSIEVFAKRGSREICKPNVPEILKKDPPLMRSLHVHSHSTGTNTTKLFLLLPEEGACIGSASARTPQQCFSIA
jgi:hypothetical protein